MSYLITRRDRILIVLDRWTQQYPRDLLAVRQGLAALDLMTCDRGAVDTIIGNTSWTDLICDECKRDSDALVHVGSEPDYDSRSANLCPACLARAFARVPA